MTKGMYLFRLIVVLSCSIIAISCLKPPKQNITNTASKASISKTFYGEVEGEQIFLYSLENSEGMQVKVMNYGGTITDIITPDKNGKFESIVLGFDSLRLYTGSENSLFGSAVGRVANRISNAQFELDGKVYSLTSDIHGGKAGFDRKVWSIKEVYHKNSVALALNYLSKEGEEGFPGNLNVTITYTLTNNNELVIDYLATTDKATPVVLTNHSYFNLSGSKTDQILTTELVIFADKYIETGEGNMPTGRILDVRETPFDFTNSKPIGKHIHDITDGNRGYDLTYVLRNQTKTLALAAEAYEPLSGRHMKVYTTEPGIVFYTGNYLSSEVKGRGGKPFTKHGAFCLETQHFPDSPNHPNFPSVIVRPGEKFSSQTVYAFSAGNTHTSNVPPSVYVNKAVATFKAIYQHYGDDNSHLLRETYPFNASHAVTYLANDEDNNVKIYSYLWPFSGSLSATVALYEATGDKEFIEHFDNKVWQGLEKYYDSTRQPAAYASYINTAPPSDRFYDDNVWIGIDFTDMYLLTGENKYLDKGKEIWTFIESGTDSLLGGGIYWCEQKRTSKNTCSNAPGAVYALKLFEATGDSTYFRQGKELYKWTKQHLQDPTDFLYYDNIRLNGRVDNRKYAYNSGQMMQAAVILYKLTNDQEYLRDAQLTAQSAHTFFFHPFTSNDGESFMLLNKGDIWFTAIMLRGFIELFHQDSNKQYLEDYSKSLTYAWEHMRDNYGLFGTDWSGKIKDNSKWLLTQFAMVEMYARLSFM